MKDKAKKIINKKLRILKKDIEDISNIEDISKFIPIDDIKKDFEKLHQRITNVENKDFIALNKEINNLTLECIYFKQHAMRYFTPIDPRMGYVYDKWDCLPYEKCKLCEENHIDHLCIGIYANRIRCIECLITRIRVQKFLRCQYCTKKYNEYKQKKTPYEGIITNDNIYTKPF